MLLLCTFFVEPPHIFSYNYSRKPCVLRNFSGDKLFIESILPAVTEYAYCQPNRPKMKTKCLKVEGILPPPPETNSLTTTVLSNKDCRCIKQLILIHRTTVSPEDSLGAHKILFDPHKVIGAKTDPKTS